MIILVLVLSDFGFCNKLVGSMIQWCINNIKRPTCSHLLTKGTLSELVCKSEQMFLVYRNQRIWVYWAILKSQGTNDWKYNHKYSKAFLQKKGKGKTKKVCVYNLPVGTWFCSVLGRTVL